MDYAINAMLVFPLSDIVMEAATGVVGNMCSQSTKNRTKAGKVLSKILNTSNLLFTSLLTLHRMGL